jgi:glycerol-3-phosphate dehydrogenase
MNRNEIFSDLKKNPAVSVLIIGAGINGIGVFRDLALNGVDVLLIDREDFCSGASAASSHMAHGGIRYLENGNFRLVREAVQERNRLLQNAPHIVKPLPTTIPIFKRFSGLLNAPLKFLGWLNKPAERGALVIKLGLTLYDAYAEKTRVMPRHQFLSRAESLKRWTRLNPKIINTAAYYDGAISNPERLALELVLDAEADNPTARALNYATALKGEDNKIIVRDELTNKTYEARPKLVVNATGAWIDFSNYNLGLPTRYISGTKGSHIVLNHPELRAAIGENEFFFENKDGRIVLIFPLFDRVLVGASDIPIQNPDEARCTDEEAAYFLEMIQRVFPDLKVDSSHIVFRCSGVRPLPRSAAKNVGQVSRGYSLEVLSGDWTSLSFPVYSLVGGKWTSFRAFSELVADKALAFLDKSRQKNTRDLPIGGGRGYSTDVNEQKRQIDGLVAWTGLDKERLQILYLRYGSRATDVAAFIKRGEDAPLKSLPAYTRREIMFLTQNEKAFHIDDILLRRAKIAMLGRATKELIAELAEIMSASLGWDEEQKNVETTRALYLLADKHGVEL